MITDTERLDFILGYFDIEDIGDEEWALGVRINSELLEDDLGFVEDLDVPLRDIIDIAIKRA